MSSHAILRRCWPVHVVKHMPACESYHVYDYKAKNLGASAFSLPSRPTLRGRGALFIDYESNADHTTIRTGAECTAAPASAMDPQPTICVGFASKRNGSATCVLACHFAAFFTEACCERSSAYEATRINRLRLFTFGLAVLGRDSISTRSTRISNLDASCFCQKPLPSMVSMW